MKFDVCVALLFTLKLHIKKNKTQQKQINLIVSEAVFQQKQQN